MLLGLVGGRGIVVGFVGGRVVRRRIGFVGVVVGREAGTTAITAVGRRSHCNSPPFAASSAYLSLINIAGK